MTGIDTYVTNNNLIINLLIGGCSGMISRTITAPIELYKIQKQCFFIPNSNLSYVIKHEGIVGLWKGNGINCLRIFPQTAIQYVGNNICFNVLNSTNSNDRTLNLFIAGSLGGLMGSFITYPFETIRTRYSVQSKCGVFQNAYSILRNLSITDMYRGVSLHIVGHVPFNALTFTFYNQYRNIISDNFSGVSQRKNNIYSGLLAGSSAVLFTYPTDTIRRRLQLQGFNSYVPQYKSVKDCVTNMYKNEGLTGFYTGLHAGLLKMGFAMSLQFTLFAEFQKVYRTRCQQ